ncbi:MAG: hypothetical protein J6D34_04205 [Atopobiaceae bacterium]|nr:hypothetical protein [Atopobiaceae bacterium]
MPSVRKNVKKALQLACSGPKILVNLMANAFCHLTTDVRHLLGITQLLFC